MTYLGCKVLLNESSGGLVDLLILMGLQGLDTVQTVTFFHHHTQLLCLPEFLSSLSGPAQVRRTEHTSEPTEKINHHRTYSEDVGEGVQDDQHRLAVLGGEEVTQGIDGTGLYQVDDLVNSTAAGVVGDSPHSFLLRLVVTL